MKSVGTLFVCSLLLRHRQTPLLCEQSSPTLGLMVNPSPLVGGWRTNQPATERYRLPLTRAKFWRNFSKRSKTKRFRLVYNMSCEGARVILRNTHATKLGQKNKITKKIVTSRWYVIGIRTFELREVGFVYIFLETVCISSKRLKHCHLIAKIN